MTTTGGGTTSATTGASDTGRLPGCLGVNELGCRTVSIAMATPRGDVVMESCSACDQRRWHVDGEPADLDGALDGLASTRRG